MITEPNRRDFIKTLLAAGAGVQFLGLVTQRAKAASPLSAPMNFILIITDQERPPMWIPPDWESQNLLNTTRLRQNGLSFTQAFCCSAMCTPSRASIFTGLFPSQHHAPWTLTEDFQQTNTEPQLDPSLPNLATCMAEAGYDVVYKGKWHLSHGMRGADGEWVPDDISRYGFHGWVPPDSGGDTRLENFGGGDANHDFYYIEQAKGFLQDRLANPTDRPFFLIVSLVNPHDVLSYPGPPSQPGEDPYYIQGGYTESWLDATTPPIPLPPTIDEDLLLNFKPSAHDAVRAVMAGGLGLVATEHVQQKYLNFYGNLLKKVDGQIGELLAIFDNAGTVGADALNQTIIIRTSDHGENGLCHGALRQKTFVAYDEALRVPLIWSNPILFPTARTSDAMVSHVDLLPTLCSLADVPNWTSKGFSGIDYSSILLDPLAPPVQDYILFTFDDIFAGGDAANFPQGTVGPPNCLRVIRTKDFKYARYFDKDGVEPDEEEFYDLRSTGGDYNATYDLPTEIRNLSIWAEDARADSLRPNVDPLGLTQEQEEARTDLMNRLAILETTRLAPAPYASSVSPGDVNLEIKRWDDPTNGPQAKVQVSFYSRLNTNYQLQRSSDLVTWNDTGGSVPGNGSVVVMTDVLDADKAFYRVQWAEATPAPL